MRLVAPRPFDAAAELQSAARLLRENLILAAPTAVASLVVLLLVVTMLTTLVGSFFAAAAVHGLPAAAASVVGVGSLVALLAFGGIVGVSLLAHAIVVHAAEAAWGGRRPDLRASAAAAVVKLPQVFVAGVATFAILLLPLMISAVLIGLPLLAVASFFFIYVMPAIMLGGTRRPRRDRGLVSAGIAERRFERHRSPEHVRGLRGRAADLAHARTHSVRWLAYGLRRRRPDEAYVALVAARFYSVLNDRQPVIS